MAARHKIPFYVAAPTSSIDLKCKTGADIPIEERDASEIARIGNTTILPRGVAVANPAFDVTPSRYVTGIITENGVARKPYRARLKQLVNR